MSDAAAVIICVPTPLDEHLTPDLSILRAACSMVVDAAIGGQLLLLTSTTYAGCTRDLLLRPLQMRGLSVGRDVFVAFSPERIDPGNAGFAHEDVPRVVGGATEACLRLAVALLGRYAHSVHPVGSMEAAEMTKLLENTFRAVNIALANEFAEACRVARHSGHGGHHRRGDETVRVHAVRSRVPVSVGTASRATRTTCSGNCASRTSRCR